jgi:Protein of unknown function (DUF2958)
MDLIPEALRERMLANDRNLPNNDDPIPVVKLFTPDAAATWLLTEIDSEDMDRGFGLCDLGLGFPELGYVSLSEITSIRGKLSLPVERDLYFKPKFRISVYAEAARRAGGIVEDEQLLTEAAQTVAAKQRHS